MDVVDLLDLCFHSDEPVLNKNNLTELSEKKNKGTLDLLFSPVFLKRQGLSIHSINYAFFGQGPFLAVVEVGPSRSAHEKLYSQTNRKFILMHDLNHARSTNTSLKVKYPSLFSAFRALHDKIDALKVDADRDYLHMGLFLLGHKFVDYFDTYLNDAQQPPLRHAVDWGLKEVKERIVSGFYARSTFTHDNNYVVFFKDALIGMAQVMEKHAANPIEKMLNKAIQNNFSNEKRKEASAALIPRFLNNFIKKFVEAAEPLITAIDQERAEKKDIAG